MPTKRVMVILSVALIAGLLASALVFNYVRKVEEGARRAEIELRPVLIATSDIPIGTRLDTGLMDWRKWPKADVPQGAVSEPEVVVGRLVKAEIARGEPILESRLFPKDLSGAPGVMSVLVPPGKRAMAVGVNEVIGVSGFILPKDRVDVIATRTDAARKTAETILQNIEVLAAGKRLEQEGKQNVEVPTVTLAVSPVEAERLALALQEGKIHIALRSVMDAKVVGPAAPTRPSAVRRTARRARPEAVAVKSEKRLVVEVMRGDKRAQEAYALE